MTFVGIVDEVGTYWRQISLKKHNNSNNTRVSNSKININNNTLSKPTNRDSHPTLKSLRIEEDEKTISISCFSHLLRKSQQWL